MQNTMQIGYQGLVEVKYIINGKEITVKHHNAGLKAMFKFLCRALANETATVNRDKPTYLDIVCRYIDPIEGIQDASCVYNLLSLSKPECSYDSNLENWVTKFNVAINHSMINNTVLAAHPGCQIVLVVKSQAEESFAEFELDTKKISLADITPGTQALVQ